MAHFDVLLSNLLFRNYSRSRCHISVANFSVTGRKTQIVILITIIYLFMKRKQKLDTQSMSVCVGGNAACSSTSAVVYWDTNKADQLLLVKFIILINNDKGCMFAPEKVLFVCIVFQCLVSVAPSCHYFKGYTLWCIISFVSVFRV